MSEDKEKVVERVVGFLYNALDNFRDTISDVSGSINQLMDSLQKVTSDLQSIGVAAPTRDSGALRTTLQSARGAGDSRSRLISLLSGGGPEAVKAAPSASPQISVASPKPTGKPIGAPSPIGAPKPLGMPKPRKSMSGPPKPMSTPKMVAQSKPMSVPIAKPMSVPKPISMPKPKGGLPVMKPPVMKPPVMKGPPVMKPPTASPMSAPSPKPAAKPGGGSSILGLRDEMLKELKRLKSIMKGG